MPAGDGKGEVARRWGGAYPTTVGRVGVAGAVPDEFVVVDSTRPRAATERSRAARRSPGRGGMSEAHVPAQHPPARQAPRVPPPDGDPGGSGDPQGPPAQGPPAAVGLTRRIRRRATFHRFRDEGEHIRLGSLWVSVIADPAAAPPHVAFALGRRIGGAVTRNRLRRRLRALVAEVAPQLPPGWYLVGVTSAAAPEPFAALQEQLRSLPDRLAEGRSHAR